MKQGLILIFISISFLAKAQLSKTHDFTIQLGGGYYTYFSEEEEILGDTAGINFFIDPTYNYGIAYNRFINRNYQTTLGFYYNNTSFIANYYCTSCDSLLVKTDEIYDLNYLNIPVNFHFIVYEDIHSIYFYLGVSANILLNGNRQVYNLNNELVTVNLPDIVKNVYLGLSIGLDYKAQVAEDIEILIGFKFNQAAGSILNDFTFRSKQYGINGGLVFAF